MLALAGATALAGCTASAPDSSSPSLPSSSLVSPGPVVLPESPADSASSSSSSSPSPTVPAVPSSAVPSSPAVVAAGVVPAAARQRTPAGAMAFVRHFFAEYNRAVTTPATGLLAPLSLPTCSTCSALDGDAQKLVEVEEKYVVPPCRVESVTCVECSEEQETQWGMGAWVFSRRADIVDRAGVVRQTTASSSDMFMATIEWRAQGWSMARLRVARPS